MTRSPNRTDASLDAMTITQLAEQSGVPPRRIRYYVSERLIPPPVGKGRAAHYTQRHLHRLNQISAFREVNLSLSEIRYRIGEDAPVGGSSREIPGAQSWRRWEVVPGVVLHAREDLDATTMSAVRVMVGAIRHVLHDSDRSEFDDTGEPE